jgi:hypothetical protein
MHDRLAAGAGLAIGLLAGLLLWALVLGLRVAHHGPGLWTLRFERVIECGLDYNGPPYTDGIRLWLTCGEERGQAR